MWYERGYDDKITDLSLCFVLSMEVLSFHNQLNLQGFSPSELFRNNNILSFKQKLFFMKQRNKKTRNKAKIHPFYTNDSIVKKTW